MVTSYHYMQNSVIYYLATMKYYREIVVYLRTKTGIVLTKTQCFRYYCTVFNILCYF